ncbi:hypothetical protein SRIMM317S_02670 [Streptomyces rimosus subsp. rimosus]
MASPHSPAMDTTTGSHPSTPVDGPAHRSAGASIDRFTRRSPRPGHPYRREDHHTTALTHALVAAGRGYAVIPLTRAKLPAVASPAPRRPGHRPVPRRLRPTRTRHPRRHRRPARRTPPLRGRALGHRVRHRLRRPPYHLIGIDLDTKHGADGLTALRLLAEEHHVALPPTVTVRTPSGGHHLYFSGPPSPPVPNSAGRLAPGIDIRGTGGYLVGPGSHTSRGAYTLTPGTPRTPTPAPPALLHLLTHLPHTTHPHNTRPRPTPHTPSTPAPALLRFVRTAPNGQRNARLFWAACRAPRIGPGPGDVHGTHHSGPAHGAERAGGTGDHRFGGTAVTRCLRSSSGSGWPAGPTHATRPGRSSCRGTSTPRCLPNQAGGRAVMYYRFPKVPRYAR